MSEVEFTWEGDLEDDCTLRFGDFLCHVESLDTLSFDDEDMEHVFAAVYVDKDTLYSSSDSEGLIISMEQGRAICEAILRAYTIGANSVSLVAEYLAGIKEATK